MTTMNTNVATTLDGYTFEGGFDATAGVPATKEITGSRVVNGTRLGPQRIAANDGDLATLGALADAAWAGSGNATAIALLKALYTLLTTGNTNTTGIAKESGGNLATVATNTASTATNTASTATNTASAATSTASTATSTASTSTTLGAQADAAWSGSGNASAIALLKALYTLLGTGNTNTTGLAKESGGNLATVVTNTTGIAKESGGNLATLATNSTNTVTNTSNTATNTSNTATNTANTTTVLGTTADTAWTLSGNATLDAILKAVALVGGTTADTAWALSGSATLDAILKAIALVSGTTADTAWTLSGSATLDAILKAIALVSGTTADTAYTTGSGSLVALLKGVFARLAALTQTDANSYLYATLGTRLAGEDITNDVFKTEQRGTSAIITTNASTAVKSGPGMLYSLTFADPGSAWVATVYDNTSATGTPMAFKPTAMGTVNPGIAVNNGLYIVTTGTTAGTLIVSYR